MINISYENESWINIWGILQIFHFLILCCDLMFQQEESEVGLVSGNGQLLTLGLGLLATALAAAYVTRLAKVLLF